MRVTDRPESPFDDSLRKLRAIVHADTSALYWWHETSQRLITLEAHPKWAQRELGFFDDVPSSVRDAHAHGVPVVGGAGNGNPKRHGRELMPVVAFPIANERQRLGVLAAYHGSTRPISQQELAELARLARDVARRLPEARAAVEARTRDFEAAAIMHAIRKIRTAWGDETWNIIAQAVMRLTAADVVLSVMMTELGFGETKCHLLRGLQDEPQFRPLSLRRSFVLERSAQWLIRNRGVEAGVLSEFGLADSPLGSMAVVPIGDRAHIFGAIIVGWFGLEAAQPARIAVIERLAASVASVLELSRAVPAHSSILPPQGGIADALQYILKFTQKLSLSGDSHDVVQLATSLAVPDIADFCEIDLLDHQGNLQPAVSLATKDNESKWVRTFVEAARPYLRDDHGLPRVLDQTAHEIHEDVIEELTDASDAGKPALRVLASIDMRSSASIALKALGRTIGVMTFASSQPKQFSGTRLMLAEALAHRTAHVVELARMYEQERDIAGELQRGLVPIPSRGPEGVDLDALYLPARGESQIGGDWYDVFPINENLLGVSIGDVVGHGVHSAIQMNAVRQSIRAAAIGAAAVGDVLRAANKVLELEDRHSFVTAIYGTLDVRRWRFTFASAGHPPPVLIDVKGQVGFVELLGPPLGTGDHTWRERELTIVPGETLVLFTDGLTEFSHDIEDGERRLLGAIKGLVQNGEAVTARSIFARTLEGSNWRDDVAILVLHLSGIAPLDLRVPAQPMSSPLIRRELRAFLDRCPLNEEKRFNLLVAAGEAVANAIEHPIEREDEEVLLRAWLDGSGINIRVGDSGKWKQQEWVQRGRGIPLMQSLVSDFKIWNEQSGTYVELREPCAATHSS